LEAGSDLNAGSQQWLTALCNQSLKIFDSYAWNGPIEDSDPKRVVLARKKLGQFNHGNKIRGLLGLPVDQPDSGRKGKGKTQPDTTQRVL
jgi:CRISPR system Cascade subunit CasA